MSDLVARLRAAGCVFAEDEARILLAEQYDAAALERAVARRVDGEPLEHIVGWVDFGSCRLAVGPGVFIPRQRSLFLASQAISSLAAEPNEIFVEAYAGVAPIAATVSRAVPGVRVHAVERAEAATQYAAVNLPNGQVHVGDCLRPLPAYLRGRVAVIAAVPPYVPDDALDSMPAEAREHEPRETHRGGADGLDDVRRLVGEARDWLRPGGVVLVELHRDQVPVAISHASNLGYEASAPIGDDGQTAVLTAVAASL
ncbi:class I SAM-dependent methyltransferase [Epidermidibacterium keratini]|uniref:hypothetical protein n=1 Tax=Epidermidibacterium keratini TaxID=1891644 RepID=UPI001CEF8E07|nr:hypothetical protein [Epidermidibacterium keratini]